MALDELSYSKHKRKNIMIKPSIGRVVLVKNVFPSPGEQDTPALICFVYHDRLVNLAAFTAGGKHRAMEQVQLVQEGDLRPSTGYYAEWMPFQVGQAKAQAAAAEVPGAVDDKADSINDLATQSDDDAPLSD